MMRQNEMEFDPGGPVADGRAGRRPAEDHAVMGLGDQFTEGETESYPPPSKPLLGLDREELFKDGFLMFFRNSVTGIPDDSQEVAPVTPDPVPVLLGDGRDEAGFGAACDTGGNHDLVPR